MGHQIFELGMTFMVDDTMRERRGGELVKGQDRLVHVTSPCEEFAEESNYFRFGEEGGKIV
jgi:hypothetical protein